MTAQTAEEAAHQVGRLIALGYKVKDVTPALALPDALAIGESITP